jgi:hypothetical protein
MGWVEGQRVRRGGRRREGKDGVLGGMGLYLLPYSL